MPKQYVKNNKFNVKIEKSRTLPGFCTYLLISGERTLKRFGFLSLGFHFNLKEQYCI